MKSLPSCENCGLPFESDRPSRNPPPRFCEKSCYLDWWRGHVQPKMSRAGNRVLAELAAEGKDPRYAEEAQRSRSEKATISNKEKPRRRSNDR